MLWDGLHAARLKVLLIIQIIQPYGICQQKVNNVESVEKPRGQVRYGPALSGSMIEDGVSPQIVQKGTATDVDRTVPTATDATAAASQIGTGRLTCADLGFLAAAFPPFHVWELFGTGNASNNEKESWTLVPWST